MQAVPIRRRQGETDALDHFRHSSGALAFGVGDFLHFGWIHSHPAGYRHSRCADSTHHRPKTDLSGTSERAKQAGGQGDYRPDQRERAAYGDAHHSEGEEDKPYKRIKNQRDQSQWPTEDKQNQPQQKFHHSSSTTHKHKELFPERAVGPRGSLVG